MLIVISPAKSLDFKTEPTTQEYTIPEFLNESEKLVSKLRKMSAKKLSALMNISADSGKPQLRTLPNLASSVHTRELQNRLCWLSTVMFTPAWTLLPFLKKN
jgi:cytoplasmic iron level regulating protein YaaA (DUF328/UPF0246 family)